HAFLGLRLECAQCHRHPHDVWQQDHFLSFANFFMHVRPSGFQGDNEKKFPEVAHYIKRFANDAKTLVEKLKKLRESRGKELEAAMKKARQSGSKAEAAAAQKALEQFQKEVAALDRRSKMLPEVGRRMMHSEIQHLAHEPERFATVTSPLGT